MTPDSNPKRVWFRAKQYGWGWYPATWQGWGVLVMYIFSVMDRSLRFAVYPQTTLNTWMELILQIYILTVFLIIICYATGEKPAWRWGGGPDNGPVRYKRWLVRLFSYLKRHVS